MLTVFSCSKNDAILKSKITAELIQSKKLDLSRYNDFEWDHLIIIPPYSNLSQIEEKQNISLKNVSNSIEELDDINLIVFLKKGKAVKSIELKRSYGDFKKKTNTLIAKQKANFNLTGHIFPEDPAVLNLIK